MDTLPRSRPTLVRHKVLWLTVAAYMITYMDRVVISSAAPVIRQEFGFSLETMGYIIAAFRWSYALFQIPGGWFGDRFGPRRALTIIVTWWSLFTSATALAWNAVSMIAFRFLFGIGEAGAFPVATRSLSRWMLPRERAWAQGVTHAGSRLGGAITPLLVVPLIAYFGWRAAFVAFGALGLVWALAWYVYYRDSPADHRAVNSEELHLIHSALGDARTRTRKSVPWAAILSSSNLWILCAMYFCYAYCLALYLDWLPTYLKESRGFDLKRMGLYASLPLFAGTLGDMAGGWISDLWVKRTGNLAMGRRAVAILGFLMAAGFIVPAALVTDPLASVWYTCLALFGLEITVGVSWAIPLDIGGDYAGSVSAVMNTCGNIGGAISSTVLAYLVAWNGWNVPFFASCVLSLIAACLFLRIDATRKILASEREGL